MPVNINFSARKASENDHGVQLRPISKDTFLNQVNGTPVSLSPGLPDLEDQFSQLGFIDLRAHDWYGVADIDSYYNPKMSGYIGQIINNAPNNKVEDIKKFATNFFNRRTICLNAKEFYKGTQDPVYNWEPTDYYLKRSLSNRYYTGDRKPNVLFRIGRMLDGGRREPNNVDKYCELVKEVVTRYSINYASVGLPVPIKEYQVWNEPDLGLFWSTPYNNNNAVKNFYEFYKKVSKAIFEVYPEALIGPCGTANAYGNKDYVDNLIRYIKTNNLPMGFYSYHFYGDATANPKNIFTIQSYVRNILDKNGYKETKCYITEWGLTAFASKENNSKLQSLFAGAFMLSFLLNAEQAGIDKAYLYRGDAAEFGLFNDQNNPKDPSVKNFCTYAGQCLYIYNLFTLKRFSSIVLNTETIQYGINTAGAINENEDEITVLIVNNKVDTRYVGYANRKKLPEKVTLQAQHYIDSNISPTNIDSERWYGSASVPEINRNDVGDVPQGPYSKNDNSKLEKDKADYSHSKNGYNLKISEIPYKYKYYTVTSKKVYLGGQLTSLDGETVSEPQREIPLDRIITVSDNDPVSAGYYSAALVTIQLLE